MVKNIFLKKSGKKSKNFKIFSWTFQICDTYIPPTFSYIPKFFIIFNYITNFEKMVRTSPNIVRTSESFFYYIKILYIILNKNSKFYIIKIYTISFIKLNLNCIVLNRTRKNNLYYKKNTSILLYLKSKINILWNVEF